MTKKPNQSTAEWRRLRNRIDEVIQLAEDGCNYRQIADYFGMEYKTFRRYINKYPELDKAISVGKKRMVTKLKGKLYSQAMGMIDTNVTSTKTVKVIREYIDDETGLLLDREEVVTTVENNRINGYGKGDIKAIELLLKAYEPETFNVNATSSDNSGIEPIAMIDDIPDVEDDEPQYYYDDTQDEPKDDE